LIDNPDLSLEGTKILSALESGWSNYSSASVNYLVECVRFTNQAKLPILECGSGLSTIVAGLIAKRNGNTLWSLEDSRPWYEEVKHYVDKYGIDSVKLVYSPLIDHGDFSWYDAPLDTMSEKFSLVICDGPLSEFNEKARRYGLFPVMNQRFIPGGVILYDNVELEHEKEGLLYWIKELNLECEKIGSYRPHYRITVPRTGQ